MIKIIKKQPTQASKATEPQKPDVVVLLDESGSMTGVRKDVITTFNEFLNTIRDTAETVSLYAFDNSGIREVFHKESPTGLRNITEADYTPNGMTPLYDAMGLVIAEFNDSTRPVQFVTHTDGNENCSTEWNFDSLQTQIKDLTKTKGWLFVYLGEGLGQAAISNFSGLKMNFNASCRSAAMHGLGEITAKYSATMSTSFSDYTATGDTIHVDKGHGVKPGTDAKTAKSIRKND